MILSAMMFALGAFVSGLVWLVLTVALVRRARRLTERRLLASISTRRVEFETERDELRARHAMQMHRLEREVSRGLDMATAYRLEADIKERDLTSARAELEARDEDMQELQERLALERDLVQDLERRHAEAGTMLRAVQHALTLEVSRRMQAQSALDDATGVADRRRLELGALRAQNEALRAAIGDRMPAELAALSPPPIAVDTRLSAKDEPTSEVEEAVRQGGSVVALPTRPRQIAGDAAEQSAALVAEAARDLQRLAGESHDDANGSWRSSNQAEPRMPVADAPEEPSVIADLDAHRAATGNAGGPASDEAAVGESGSDARFFEALAEIRALRRAAKQAGE
jgi:hypothetical protein